MKRSISLFSIFLLPFISMAQFEQQISVYLSGGIFSTFGADTYMPDYGSSAEDEQPVQIANYKPGVYTSLGIQYNLSRNFSIKADAGVMHAGQWYYDDEGSNYTGWAVWDPVTDDLLAEGFNDLTISNISIGLTPKYFLLPGKIVNPFIFTGISLNMLSTTYEDNEWAARRDHDLLDDPDEEPERANIEKNTGIGFHPGVGLDLSLSDRIGFHLSAGLYLALLNEDNFYVVEQHENLQAITLQAGLRFSFLKSKDI